MGQSQPFDRELVLTDATLAVVAARQRGMRLDAAQEAQRILERFPMAGITLAELAAAIEQIQSKNPPA